MAELQNFPDDLLTQILKRLPPKPLLQFLTVSKSWYTLITSTNFISSHLQFHHTHNLSHPNHVLFLLESNFCHFLWRYPHPFLNRTPLPFPCDRAGSVAGSCNGLVCLISLPNETISLWNPSIQRFIYLDSTPVFSSHSNSGSGSNPTLVFGFGFDSSQNDYKVVAISYYSQFEAPPQARFYSVNGGIWKDVRLPGGCAIWNEDLNHISESCFVNGVIHWIMSRGAVEPAEEEDYSGVVEFAASLLTFNLSVECFGEMELPPGLGNAIDPDICLSVIDNSIAVIHLVGEGSEYVVWKMMESSWNVVYRIVVPCPFKPNPFLWDWQEGKVFITTSLGMLIAMKAKDASSPVVFYGDIATFGGQAFGYTESLVFLDKFSEAPWLQTSENRELVGIN